MVLPDLVFMDYRAEFGLATVKMWRRAMQRALGIEEHNRYAELAGQLAYFETLDPHTIDIVLDPQTSSVVALRVLSPGELHHLYVDVEYQGRGIGTNLLNTAKIRSPQGIELFTFARNTQAQGFYLAHGFLEVERGYADLADNPWAESRQALADIKYRWLP